MWKRGLVLTVLTFLALGNIPANGDSRTFPISISEGNLPTVRVTAGKDVESVFILDTGAGVHVISKGLLARLPSRPAGRFTGFRHNGERIDFDLFEIPSLRIGSFVQTKPIVAAWDVLDKAHIDGILSAKFFEHHVVTIDFKNKHLTFERKPDLRRREHEGTVVPLKLCDDRGISLDLFVDVTLGAGMNGLFELDTGSASMASIDARFMPLLGLEGSKESTRSEAKSLLGGVEIRYNMTIDRLSLRAAPAISVQEPRVTFKENMIYDGLLGMPFWLGRTMTLDVEQKRLIVTE